MKITFIDNLKNCFTVRAVGFSLSAIALCILPYRFSNEYALAADASTKSDTARVALFSAENMCPPKPDPTAVLDNMTEAELKAYANAAFWNDQYSDALIAIKLLSKRANCTEKNPTHGCLEIGMNTAILDLQLGHLKEAKTRLSRLLPAVKSTAGNNGLDDPDCQFFIAETEYRGGDYSEAINSYKRALALYRKVLPPYSPDLAPALEGLAGCLYRKRDFVSVEPVYEELAKIDYLTRGPKDLRFAWSLMNLADIFHKLGREEDRKPLFKTAVYIFRKKNQERILEKMGGANIHEPASAAGSANTSTTDADSTLQSNLKTSVFGNTDLETIEANKQKTIEILKLAQAAPKSENLIKRPFNFDNWRFKRSQKVDAPGFVIVDPSVPLKGLIICVHGLGLHHKSYEDFGNKISKMGYGIISFDMRGFGGYKDEKGYDLVDLEGCVADLGGILKEFRRDYPNTSIFLLGESMGGAIALHVAVKYQDLLQGLVSSVPSGSRYKAKKTSLEVAFKLLHGKNKQFDIGSQVVNQATQDENLRKEWKDDPAARMDLSASELLKFQKFMNQNEHLAKDIKTMPVIIFQGFGDKLVKPEGTLALYNALGTKYKNLELIGHQEHLIFEDAQCPPEVMDGLLGWLNNHSKKLTAGAPDATSN